MVLPREKRAAVQRGSEGDRASHSGVELLPADMKTWYPRARKRKKEMKEARRKKKGREEEKGKRKEGNGRETRRDGLVGVMWGTRCKFATLGQRENQCPEFTLGFQHAR